MVDFCCEAKTPNSLKQYRDHCKTVNKWKFEEGSNYVNIIKTLAEVEAAWRVLTNADDWFNEMVTLLRLRYQAYQMRDARCWMI